jgi:hypothetical protein
MQEHHKRNKEVHARRIGMPRCPWRPGAPSAASLPGGTLALASVRGAAASARPSPGVPALLTTAFDRVPSATPGNSELEYPQVGLGNCPAADRGGASHGASSLAMIAAMEALA